MRKEYDLTQLKVKRRGQLPGLPQVNNEDIIHDDDSPATTEADWAEAFACHSAAQLHAEVVRRKLEADKLPSQEQVAIGFDAEVLEYFRATGNGWQARMNDALKEWLKEHAA